MKNHTLGILAFLAIAAVIAANIVPNFLRAQSRRDFMGCRSNLKNIGLALEIYSQDGKRPYPETLAALVPDVLLAIPSCPAAEKDEYSETYEYVPAAAGAVGLYGATQDCAGECWRELEASEKALAELEPEARKPENLPESLRSCKHGAFLLGPARGSYSFHCAGHLHDGSGIPEGYPLYDSRDGLVDRP